METTPLRKATRVPIVQALNGLTVASFADGALLSGARVMSEGAIVDGEGGERVYAGSTMVSVALRDEAGPIDAGAIGDDALLAVVGRSIGFRLRLLRLARAEAERRCAPYLVRELRSEPVFRIDGGVLFVDIDVECPLAEPWSGEDHAGKGAP